MGLIPLPSPIHYELLMQLLERQTLPALDQTSRQYAQIQEVIVHLRKALTGQKQLEESCTRMGLAVEYRWSLNKQSLPGIGADLLPQQASPGEGSD
jgi:hypothetical protein